MTNTTTAKELNKAVKSYETLASRLAETERWVGNYQKRIEERPNDSSYYKAEVRKGLKKIEELKVKVADAYTADVAEELKAREEMIPHFEPVIQEMVNAWIEFDKAEMEKENRIREARNTDRKELTKDEFNAKYRGCYRIFYEREEALDEWTEKHEATLRELYRREAICWIYDLRFRCMDYVGCITDYSELTAGRKSLEGFVTGTCGRAEVHSIWAGGYNIQRLHVRVLIRRLG